MDDGRGNVTASSGDRGEEGGEVDKGFGERFLYDALGELAKDNGIHVMRFSASTTSGFYTAACSCKRWGMTASKNKLWPEMFRHYEEIGRRVVSEAELALAREKADRCEASAYRTANEND